MDMKELKKMKMYLQNAMECLDSMMNGDMESDDESEDMEMEDEGDDSEDMGKLSGLKMSLSKYK